MMSQPANRPCREPVREQCAGTERTETPEMHTEEKHMLIRHWLATVLIVASTVVATGDGLAAPTSGSSAESAPPSDAERALQERLIAPCCWTQTLDVHVSEISTQLRAEIRARLARGEAKEAIEDDFAARFGEKIRAVPKGKDPLKRVPLVVGLAMLASAVGLVLVLRRWTRRSDGEPPPQEEPRDPRSDEYDQRLNDELKGLDG
jgi:cytochrome c-type biogenesis protein CcmH